MRMSLQVKLAVGAVVVLVGTTLAQRQPFFPGGGMGMGGPAMLLVNKSVQEELKLTDEQKEKIGKHQEKMMGRMKETFGKLKDAKPEEQREKFQELMKEAAAESDKMVKDILKPEQTKRLQQIEMQQAGIRNLLKEDTQQALKLTDDQKDKLKTIAEDVAKDAQEIFKDAGRDFQKMAEARKKVESLRKEALEKGDALLTADQKKALKELMGEPFELKQERPSFPKPDFKPPERKPGEKPGEKKPEPPKRDF